MGVALALFAATEAAAVESGWSDDRASRLAALALIETLNADLLSHDSATLTLERWCDVHRQASPARITAVRLRDAETPADDKIRSLLGVDAVEPIRHRHVRLVCGAHVLSEADNWYLPARLTPEMNRMLDTTDIAFGRAIAALKFQRRTWSVERLWHPLPEGWEMGGSRPPEGAEPFVIPAQVLRHRAVLVLRDGTPLSTLVETYTGEVLDFPKTHPDP